MAIENLVHNPASANKISHFSSIEWLRFIAAFGIVWFHTDGAPWRSVGYSGLPVFLLVFCSLIVIHHSEISFKEFVYRRSIRLLIPWVFWSLIYGLAKAFKHFFVSKESFGSMEFNWLLIGGSIHLWYLLYAFLISIFLYYVCRYTLKNEPGTGFIITVLILGILVLYLSSFATEKYAFAEPFAQWLFALPSLPIGYFLGVIVRKLPEKNRPLWFVVLFVIVFMGLIGLFLMGQKEFIIPYGIGLLLTILSLQLRFPFETLALTAGKLTYGIYLIHPLVASLLNVAFPIPFSILKIMLVFIISSIIVYFLRRTVFRFVL